MAKRLFHKVLTAAFFVFLPTSVRSQSRQNPPAQGHKPSDSPVKATFLTSPNGQIVHPGEVVHFDLSVGPGQSEGPVVLVSPLGDSNEIRNSPPYSFTLEIPLHEGGISGGLIGIHPVTAFGKIPGKDQWDLATINVDVEESEMPTKLKEVSNGSINRAPGFRFFDAGQEDWLRINGAFPNGQDLDLTHSTHLSLISENTKVVSVENGQVMSIGPGTTAIIATYSLGDKTAQISIPASVTISESGLVVAPLSLDFGEQHVGTESARQVTLTNRTDGSIKIYSFEAWQPVRDADNCTSAPLPPDGTCTFSVVFAPFRPGRTQFAIHINNDFSHRDLPVLGNGI